MGWMHDTLDYMKKESIYRSYHHHQMTFSLIYAFSENFVLSLSHDEVVHGKGSLIRKMSGDEWQKFANLRLLFGYQYMHPGKKLNFMGQEFAQWSEWNVQAGLDWQLLEYETHSKMQQWVRDLNQFYQSQPALYEHDFDQSGFQWIEADDYKNSVFVFMRFADNKEDLLIVACNFTPNPQPEYRIGVPYAGDYEEILNSDAEQYGGANIGNHAGVSSEEIESQSHQQSIRIAIPPLGLVVLRKK
jgi:1,4-alpha-glucan branching enzyme